jgi:GT2 family glycosyltransferase
VLIVCYNGRGFLPDCLGSVLASDDGGIKTRVVVVDNASGDGSAEYVAENFPRVDLVRSQVNRGFAGGNNLGWEYIRRKYPRATYLVLLNQDTIVERGWLRPMVDFLEAHPAAGLAQPKLMMHPRTELFNSSGNRSHFLGFGFVGECGQPDRGQYTRPRPIASASGAAMMVRTDLLRRVGLFEELMFLYLEDAELNWKLRQIGCEPFLVPGGVVYHKYNFQKDFRYYFYLERNRWWLLLVYYKLATLLLLAPALAVMEVGQLLFALSRGLLGVKLRSWLFFLAPANLALLRRRRRQAQARRTVSDRQFTRPFCGSIDFPELSGPLLKYVANPFFSAYWALARRLIFW